MRSTKDWQCRVERGSDRRLGLAQTREEGVDGGLVGQLDAKPASAGGGGKPGSETH
jgi:hypothetical protein